jgi:MFS family permease
MFERMLSSAVVTGFFSTMRAMLNDKLEGKDLAVAGGAMSAWAGSGVIIGPYIEVLIMRYFGPRANFAVVAVLNTVVSVVMYRLARETLALEDRKPVTVKDCSPFTFVEMCKVSGVNRKLMLALLLQSFGEGRLMQDINMLSLRENLGWKYAEISTFMSILGLTITTGGWTVKWSLEKFGMYGHTRLSNLAMALAFFIQSLGSPANLGSKYITQYVALSLWFVGGRKRDALETLCTGETLRHTAMGKGQVSSALSNFKSMAAVLGPPLSAKAYSYGLRNKWPGLPYSLIGLMYLLAEAVHTTMTKKQMGIKDEQ